MAAAGGGGGGGGGGLSRKPTASVLLPRGGGGGPTLQYIVYRSGNNTDPIKRALAARPGWAAADADDVKRDPAWSANFVWKPTWGSTRGEPSGWVRGHASVGKRQMYNHLRAVEPLCTKDSLFDTMMAYYAAVGEDAAQHLPPTYLIEPKNREEPAAWPGWRDFEAHFRRCGDVPGCRNLWLVKPTALNRGIGIEVFRDLEDIKTFLVTKARQAAMGIQPVWVLQKYIENPLLFDGRKFDFRVWVLVTDAGDVFMHAPGYVRTSSEAFDLASDDRFAHLTNYCQQVNAASFGKFEEGNTLKFIDLEDYLTRVTLPALRARRGVDAATERAGGSGDGGGGSGGDAPADAAPKEGGDSTSAGSSGGSGATTAAAAAGGAGAAEPTASPRRLGRGGKRGGVAADDKPVHLAADGEEAMWGCGRNGLWGQMRSAVIDAMEALRGRGGARTGGYEENGFARKPPPFVTVPPAPPAAAAGAAAAGAGTAGDDAAGERYPAVSSKVPGAGGGSNGYPAGAAAGTAGPTGSRHRFELLGLDFIADDDLKIYFIEVNTNPSLSYQNAWHESFADVMAVRMLDLVFDGVFPGEPAGGTGVGYVTAPPGKLRPPEGWYYVMNTYTASWKLPAHTLTAPAPAPAPAPAAAVVEPPVAVVTRPRAVGGGGGGVLTPTPVVMTGSGGAPPAAAAAAAAAVGRGGSHTARVPGRLAGAPRLRAAATLAYGSGPVPSPAPAGEGGDDDGGAPPPLPLRLAKPPAPVRRPLASTIVTVPSSTLSLVVGGDAAAPPPRSRVLVVTTTMRVGRFPSASPTARDRAAAAHVFAPPAAGGGGGGGRGALRATVSMSPHSHTRGTSGAASDSDAGDTTATATATAGGGGGGGGLLLPPLLPPPTLAPAGGGDSRRHGTTGSVARSGVGRTSPGLAGTTGAAPAGRAAGAASPSRPLPLPLRSLLGPAAPPLSTGRPATAPGVASPPHA